MNYYDFNGHIVSLCLVFRGSVVSGARSKKRNKKVGGHPESRHLLGLAADIVCDTKVDMREMFAHARRLGLHGYIRKNGKACHLQDRAVKGWK